MKSFSRSFDADWHDISVDALIAPVTPVTAHAAAERREVEGGPDTIAPRKGDQRTTCRPYEHARNGCKSVPVLSKDVTHARSLACSGRAQRNRAENFVRVLDHETRVELDPCALVHSPHEVLRLLA